jgi:hypothetical protein
MRAERLPAGSNGVSPREEEAKEMPERRGIERRRARVNFFIRASPCVFIPYLIAIIGPTNNNIYN